MAVSIHHFQNSAFANVQRLSGSGGHADIPELNQKNRGFTVFNIGHGVLQSERNEFGQLAFRVVGPQMPGRFPDKVVALFGRQTLRSRCFASPGPTASPNASSSDLTLPDR